MPNPPVVIGKRDEQSAAVSREARSNRSTIAIAVGERCSSAATMTNWRIAFRG